MNRYDVAYGVLIVLFVCILAVTGMAVSEVQYLNEQLQNNTCLALDHPAIDEDQVSELDLAAAYVNRTGNLLPKNLTD